MGDKRDYQGCFIQKKVISNFAKAQCGIHEWEYFNKQAYKLSERMKKRNVLVFEKKNSHYVMLHNIKSFIVWYKKYNRMTF